MSNPFSSAENFFDSEDLMSWLLLNPEMVEFDESQLTPPPPPPPPPPLPDSYGQTYQAGNYNGNVGSMPNNVYLNNNEIPILEESPEQKSKQIGIEPAISVNSTASGVLGKRSLANSSSASSLNNAKSSRVKSGTHGAEEKQSKIVRKRQKESVEDLEARVNELRSENADLQAHLMNVTQRTNEVQKQRQAMERLMVTKLVEVGDKEDSDQSELAKVVKQYTDIYADYGKCRQREVQFHLSQLEKLLLPTKTTKMSLWALQQDKSFFQKSKSPMFDLLSKELGLTQEQVEKVQERREKNLELLAQLKESLSLIGAIKTAIERKHACYDAVCGRVQAAATPKQTVLFLKWIATHAEILAKFIPSFSRNVHHTPNVEFVEGVAAATNTSSSSASATAHAAATSNISIVTATNTMKTAGARP